MGVFINIVIKTDKNFGDNYNMAKEYADTCLPLFQSFVEENNEKGEGFCSIGEYNTKEKYIDWDIEDKDICDMILLGNYWIFDTYYDDYLFLPYGQSHIRPLAKKLCNLLNQKEAWICIEDHVGNSITSPRNICDWLKKVEKTGIIELNNSIFGKLTKDNYGFSWKHINHEGFNQSSSYPIYHDKFEDL